LAETAERADQKGKFKEKEFEIGNPSKGKCGGKEYKPQDLSLSPL
jgi:hypothetical protein